MIKTKPRFFRLVGTIAVPYPPSDLAGGALPQLGRLIADTDVRGLHVSTYFLGIDVNPNFEGDPILFETKIFGNQERPYQTRCSTWGEAEAMHQAGILVAMGLAPPAARPRCSWVRRQLCRFLRA